MSQLLQQLLDEQQDLTAVERFAQQHADAQLPSQQKYYEHLLPATPLASGEQFGFGVDLDRCSGCKACVTACHSLNGLDETETWRDVGVLIAENEQLPILQHVTTACHHCLEPACASACPVDAYEKDPVTGIVRHLDDQCFGCQYCTLACPYDVPKYHSKKGIVRKCDMCSDRLAEGEAPACVQACPHEAISIRKVDVEELQQRREQAELINTAPRSNFTVPTTEYSGGKHLSQQRTLNPAEVQPQHAHTPLVVMLVLSQLSVGMFLTLAFVEFASIVFGPLLSSVSQVAAAVTAFLIGQMALAAATLHLGRPQYAFRAIVGIRHSWLSREIAVFGAYTAASGTYTGIVLLPNVVEFMPALSPLAELVPAVTAPAALLGTVVTGIAGIACSAMIYVFTRRQFWSASQSFGRFLGTAVSLGPTFVAAILILPFVREDANGVMNALLLAAIAGVAGKFLWERRCLSRWQDDSKREATAEPTTNAQLRRSAALIHGPLKSLWVLRKATVGAAVGLSFVAMVTSMWLVVPAALCAVIGEFAERTLFFKAVAPDRMPSGL